MRGEIYIREYETIQELIKGLREYFEFYNNKRPRQTFGGRTPAEVLPGQPGIKEGCITMGHNMTVFIHLNCTKKWSWHWGPP